MPNYYEYMERKTIIQQRDEHNVLREFPIFENKNIEELNDIRTSIVNLRENIIRSKNEIKDIKIKNKFNKQDKDAIVNLKQTLRNDIIPALNDNEKQLQTLLKFPFKYEPIISCPVILEHEFEEPKVYTEWKEKIVSFEITEGHPSKSIPIDNCNDLYPNVNRNQLKKSIKSNDKMNEKQKLENLLATLDRNTQNLLKNNNKPNEYYKSIYKLNEHNQQIKYLIDKLKETITSYPDNGKTIHQINEINTLKTNAIENLKNIQDEYKRLYTISGVNDIEKLKLPPHIKRHEKKYKFIDENKLYELISSYVEEIKTLKTEIKRKSEEIKIVDDKMIQFLNNIGHTMENIKHDENDDGQLIKLSTGSTILT